MRDVYLNGNISTSLLLITGVKSKLYERGAKIYNVRATHGFDLDSISLYAMHSRVMVT